MTTMIVEVYEAFKAANVADEKAQAAAKALADYENRFNKVDASLEGIKAEINMMKWILGVIVGLNVAILGLLLKTMTA